MTEIKPEFIQWCKAQYELVSENGTWAVPRSGLVFQKRDNKFVLVMKIPIPDSDKKQKWEQLQEEDYQTIKEHFEAAGIEITREDE